MVNTIQSSLFLSNLQSTRNPSSDALGKDDFLKILMTQLQNQDPLNPMQDKDFIAQMATFTSLEQITNIGTTINNLVKAQEQNQLISYNQFVGKEVNWQQTETASDGSVSVVAQGTGKVVSLSFENSTATFVLEDGTKLTRDNILGVGEAVQETQMLQASQLIGKQITYTNSTNETIQSKVISVSFKDGKTVYQLENNDTTTGSNITKIEA